MGQVSGNTDLTQITDSQTFFRFCGQVVNNIVSIVNGQINFDQNISSQTVKFTTNGNGTDQAIAHTLGRVPTMYIVSRLSASVSVYDGSAAFTANNIYLKSSAVANVTIIIL